MSKKKQNKLKGSISIESSVYFTANQRTQEDEMQEKVDTKHEHEVGEEFNRIKSGIESGEIQRKNALEPADILENIKEKEGERALLEKNCNAKISRPFPC